ncbi:MAG: Uma2 family endonuclease [Gemmataceae bacterium]|nr:Uma2 family endonuclease [Gemmataceae bacterium]
MSAPVATHRMTAEEFLALPDDPGVERWLSRGRLRERRHGDKTMTYRNRFHSRIEAQIVHLLKTWLDGQAPPRGAVLSGEAGCILQRNPDLLVGIDVVYLSAELAAHEPDSTTLIEGVPTLVVEILSPSDTQEDVNEKLDDYLNAGVPLIWVVDPHFRTVRVHRPNSLPELFNTEEELTAEPHLPGFRVPVAAFFSD